MALIHPVILCGGNGTRLWPISRPEKPKPFLPLLEERTLFQTTLARVSDRAMFELPLVVARKEHFGHIEAQAGAIETRHVIEPCSRNTAPAIALAAHCVARESLLLVCPSDHEITDEAAFLSSVADAAMLAEDGWLVTFGLVPDGPHTGYGYILPGEREGHAHRVAEFVEKPERKIAEQYVSGGRHLWNSGIFLFRAGVFLDELERYRPEMADAVQRSIRDAQVTEGSRMVASEHFCRIEAESVDFAVMQQTAKAVVVPADFGWADIGTMESLETARRRRP